MRTTEPLYTTAGEGRPRHASAPRRSGRPAGPKTDLPLAPARSLHGPADLHGSRDRAPVPPTWHSDPMSERVVKPVTAGDVPLTNLDQPLFDGADATKRDLVD